MTDLAGLLARVERADGVDREIDEALQRLAFPRATDAVFPDGTPIPEGWGGDFGPAYTGSLDAALALVERVLPGCWYLLGKGKLRAAEPLYGAQLLFGSDEVIAAGEHEASQALALLAALLRAKIAEGAQPA